MPLGSWAHVMCSVIRAKHWMTDSPVVPVEMWPEWFFAGFFNALISSVQLFYNAEYHRTPTTVICPSPCRDRTGCAKAAAAASTSASSREQMSC